MDEDEPVVKQDDLPASADEPTPAPAEPEIKVKFEAPAPEDTPAPFKFGKSSHGPAFDLVLSYAAKQGFTDKSLAIVAARQGDFSMLESQLKAMKAPDYEGYIDVAKETWAKKAEADKAKVSAIATMAVQHAGSAENWKAVQDWANVQYKSVGKDIDTVIARGGEVADLMLAGIVSAYTKGNTLNINPADVAKPNAGAGTGGGAHPAMTSEMFGNLTAELLAANPGKKLESLQAFHVMYAARKAAKDRGIE